MAIKSISGPDGSQVEITRDGVEYLIRPYEEGDAAGFLSLYRTVSNSDHNKDWFRRTYVENPYVDHVPIFVVESDGEIVGVRPFTAFRLQSGDESVLGLLTRDTMVHPDHRRRGLFSEMTKLALQYYKTAGPAFFFSHSNPKSLPGYRKMGWSPLGTRETYLRVQNVETFVSMRTRDLVTSVVSPIASPLSRAYLTVRDRTATSPDDLTVYREENVPAELLASLADSRCPTAPHIVRDEAFYRWRFQNPEWRPNTTYVAWRDGEPLAGVVTHTLDGRVSTRTSVVDVVPRTGGKDWTNAIASILDRIIADHAASTVVRIPVPIFPTHTLVERGFLPLSRLPLSVLTSESWKLTLAVRPLDGDVTLNGYRLDDAAPELWSVAH